MKDPINELKDIWNEFLEGPRELKKLGWKILCPVVPLAFVLYFIIDALMK